MKKIINLISSVLLACICIFSVLGQTGTTGNNSIPTNLPGINNIPYSAELIRETVQTLPDGNKITRTVKSLEYRDSEGRTRREEVNQNPPLSFGFSSFSIYDPVGGYSYSLFPSQKEVFRVRLLRPNEFPPTNTAMRRLGYSSQRETLGNRVIEGLETTGSRFKTIIAPGIIGNEKEIQATTESWFSPELRLTVLSISDNLQSGVMTTRFTNIKRDEPDKSLFEIPADYKIIDREPFRPPVPAPTPANNNPNESKKP